MQLLSHIHLSIPEFTDSILSFPLRSSLFSRISLDSRIDRHNYPMAKIMTMTITRVILDEHSCFISQKVLYSEFIFVICCYSSWIVCISYS